MTVTPDEIGNPITRLKDGRYWSDLRRKYFTSHIESEFTQEDNVEEAIPWRYLGNPEINNNPSLYSHNLEHTFLQFMQYYTMKEELTDVFALGRGIMEYTKNIVDPNKGTTLDNTAKYLEKAIEMQIRGKRETKFDGGLLSKDIPFIRSVRGNAERPDWVKIIRGIKSASGAPIMLLKPFQGAANAVFISLYTLKEGIKDSILQALGKDNFLGVDTNYTAFTSEDLAKG